MRGTLVGTLSAIALLASGFLLPARAYQIVAFEGKVTRWYRDQIPYTVDTSKCGDFSENGDGTGDHVSKREAIESSFDTWTKIKSTEVSFNEQSPRKVTKTGYDHVNTVSWVNDGWTDLSFSPPTNALAVTITTYKTSSGEIVDSDIHFNCEYFNWAVIDTDEEETSGVVDISNIATHEIGHFVGLNHSSEDYFEESQTLYLATMFFASGPGELFRRSLDTDDRNAILNLYPDQDVEEPEIEEVSPNIINVAHAGTVTLTITGRNFKPFSSAQIVVPGDSGDVMGNVISASSKELRASFNLTSLPSGDFDFQVSNSYERKDRLKNGFTVTGSSLGTIEQSSTGGGGGCTIQNQRTPSTRGRWVVLLLLAGALFAQMKRALRSPAETLEEPFLRR